MTKILSKVLQNALDNGKGEKGSYLIEFKERESLKLYNYGSLILSVDYTTEENEIIQKVTSNMDQRAINFVLKEMKLFQYENTLKDFKQWSADNPSFFDSDNVGKKEQWKENNLYFESVDRRSFINDEILNHTSCYQYNESTKRFNYVENENK